MRSLSLTLLAIAALLTPTAAMAASPAPATTTARYFEIKGLVLGATKLGVGGKLAIEGSKLMASAGCNMIGGEVSVDGDKVTIVGPTSMTEMACPGANGDAEAILIKILALGTFKITATAWDADGGQILTVEIPTYAPGPGGSPPDEPITSGPIATIVDPPPGGPTWTCPPSPVDGGGSTGSGGSTSSGSTGTGTASPGTVVVVPDATSGSEPGATPGSEPAATAIDLPLETGSVDPQPPAPAAGETFPLGQIDPCYGVSLGAGQVEADLAAAPKAATFDNSSAQEAVASPGLVLPLAFGLVVLVLAGAAMDRRRRIEL